MMNDEFNLPDDSCSISDIQDYFEFIIKKHETLTENPPIQIYPNKIKNRIVFKVKTGYKLEFLSSETMKLLGSVTFEIKVIKSSLFDYSDVYIIVIGDITTTGGDANARVAFKNYAPFTKCITHINDEHVDNSDNLDMENLIESVTTNQTLQEVYGSFKEMNRL